jgi:hypothetical protein
MTNDNANAITKKIPSLILDLQNKATKKLQVDI